jgi:hypothetical protein
MVSLLSHVVRSWICWLYLPPIHNPQRWLEVDLDSEHSTPGQPESELCKHFFSNALAVGGKPHSFGATVDFPVSCAQSSDEISKLFDHFVEICRGLSYLIKCETLSWYFHCFCLANSISCCNWVISSEGMECKNWGKNDRMYPGGVSNVDTRVTLNWRLHRHRWLKFLTPVEVQQQQRAKFH